MNTIVKLCGYIIVIIFALYTFFALRYFVVKTKKGQKKYTEGRGYAYF